jgi:adenylate cyclase
MVDEIFANEGVLDKFIGDAIMAIYGTPFPKPEDATNAVRSAIGMFRELDGLNAQRVARGDRPIHMGIGVNSGRAVVGNIGSPKRMEYTVIGDAVNLASRVESLTKHYAAEILVTRGTRALLAPDIAARELDLIAVKGKDQPDVIYEIIRPGGPSDWLLGDGVIERFESGIAMFRDRRFEEALTHFSAFNDDHPSDRASAIYLERCGVFMVDPPAEDWDGVWRFDTK